MKKNKGTAKFEEGLIERLRDPELASMYLSELLLGDDFDIKAFLLGLRYVAQARGITSVSKQTGLGRESLYKTLSATGNPRLKTLTALIDALGMEVKLSPKPKKRKRALAKAA